MGGSNLKRLKTALDERQKSFVKVQVRWATVTAVDWEAKTMTATGLLDDLPYHDVLLGTGSFYRKPVVGTDCLIGMIENQDAASFLIDAESIEEAAYFAGDSSYTIKESGFILKQGNESFKTVLNDFQKQVGKLCDELSKVIVAIGTGPNTVALQAIKEEITGSITHRTNQIFIE